MKGDGPQTKVHYKGADDDFIVFIAGTEILKKWKEDKSIPLVEVVQSFEVFVTSKQGAQGVLDHASHAQLDSEFGTHRDDDVVKKILEGGDMQTTSAHSKQGDTNITKGEQVNLSSGGPVHQ